MISSAIGSQYQYQMFQIYKEMTLDKIFVRVRGGNNFIAYLVLLGASLEVNQVMYTILYLAMTTLLFLIARLVMD